MCSSSLLLCIVKRLPHSFLTPRSSCSLPLLIWRSVGAKCSYFQSFDRISPRFQEKRPTPHNNSHNLLSSQWNEIKKRTPLWYRIIWSYIEFIYQCMTLFSKLKKLQHMYPFLKIFKKISNFEGHVLYKYKYMSRICVFEKIDIAKVFPKKIVVSKKVSYWPLLYDIFFVLLQYPKILPATSTSSGVGGIGSNSSTSASTSAEASRAATPIRLTPHEVANAAKMLKRIDDMKGTSSELPLDRLL